MAKELTFVLSEPKKHSGKYVQVGTESDTYPNYMYFRKDWFPNSALPQKVCLTVEAMEPIDG